MASSIDAITVNQSIDDAGGQAQAQPQAPPVKEINEPGDKMPSLVY